MYTFNKSLLLSLFNRHKRNIFHRWSAFAVLGLLCTSSSFFTACSSNKVDPSNAVPENRTQGQSEFISAPPTGAVQGRAFGEVSATSAPPQNAADSASKSTGTSERKLEETDLYRLEGNRLYYLNSYRGLMVFDVTNVDEPKFLGRSPIFGSPVEMIVRNGIAYVIVADWYGTMDDGKPFRGSIVRGIDARDPANPTIIGEAKLGGWVRDTRVVGDVIYSVSEDYGWSYGVWYEGDAVATSPIGGTSTSSVIISSVSIANGQVKQVGTKRFDGYGGVFNVTPNSIVLAHDVLVPSTSQASGKTELQYVDIRDPNGTIQLKGSIQINSRVQGWGADNGRWNIDFADQKYAHAIGCAQVYCGSNSAGYVLSSVDFSNPNAPVLVKETPIQGNSWSPVARFDHFNTSTRMYLAPTASYYYSNGNGKTPIQIFDLSNPKESKLVGQTEINGSVWIFIPAGDRLFALGSEFTNGPVYSNKVSLNYLNVADATKPSVLGTSTFGEGWAWTPAAGTFKAFTKNDTEKLVVLPFSGWSTKDFSYNNGLQLIEFSPESLTTRGAALTRGWVERGIFVNKRLVSLSDLALSVIDYSNTAQPKVIKELTLARNVVHVQPSENTIAQVSSDWWGNDLSYSDVRILPLSNAEEKSGDAVLAEARIDGYNAQVFRNGNYTYIATVVRTPVSCSNTGSGIPEPSGGRTSCWSYSQQVQVVDVGNGNAKLLGKIQLPSIGYENYWSRWGFWGCYYWDWYHGSEIVQVGGDALAFRRWIPTRYNANGVAYEEAKYALFIVDLKNPNAPALSSLSIINDPLGWWGNMKASGNKLYTTHYEWFDLPTEKNSYSGRVRYYLDVIDVSNRAKPRIESKVNIPGIFVGASESNPNLIYTIDYRWYSNTSKNEFAVLELKGNRAYLRGSTTLDGWVGQVFVRGSKAYTSVERYQDSSSGTWSGPRISLHELDLTNPDVPVDRASTEKQGWGWLLGVEGDRAMITSGWGSSGLDIYKLRDQQAPVFDQFVRTLGWGASSLARQQDQLFLASGYWGVQAIQLK